MEVINVKEKFGLFQDHWSPRIIGQLNGQDVKIAKVKGEFVWHNHKDEDELFYIIKGTLKIEFEDGMRTLKEGDMLIIPKGVEQKPIAEEEVWIMLFEPQAIKHTGNVQHEMTVDTFKKI
ncbi:MAG: cupin domain-containing protein [Bacteroidota bacterium]